MKLLGFLMFLVVIVALAVAVAFGWYMYMKIRYKTVPSNEALIITGPNLGDPSKDKSIYKDDQGRYMKVVRGGGHRLKMFQTATRVSLKSFQLNLTTPKVYTKQGVGIYGEAVATVKVSDTLDGIVKYAEQFLGKKQPEIESEIAEVLGANLRAILSKMTVEEINSDRESFNEQVREIAQDQLDRMGFRITSLGLTNLADDEGYLENLGKPKIAEVRKIAEIAEAESRREVELKNQEVAEEVAKEKYKREISISESRKEKEIKEASIKLETDKKKAEADASYELEKENRRLEIEQKRIAIEQQEKTNQLKLQRMEVENQLELEERRVEIRKKQAEADYEARVKDAEAEAKAKIEQGIAEAEVIRKRNEAEIEAIEKRAEAIAKHQNVIIREKIIEMLPEFARAVSEPLTNVESIRIMDSGNGKQIKSLPQTVTSTMMGLQEGLKQMTGLDINDIIQNLTDVNQTTLPVVVEKATSEENNDNLSGKNLSEKE